MSQLSIKLGFWSSFLSVITFITFTICFIALFLVNPVFSWTNLSDYVAYVNKYNQSFKYIAQFSMLLFGVLYIILLGSIYDYAHNDKKILARISIYFGIIFATLICTHYFIQLSAVRLNILKGHTEGLEQFIQSNPTSAIAAINMLGWTLFFGLSSLFIASVFSGNGLEKVIKYSFLANGIICILGGIGFVFEIVILVFFCMNFGMGLVVLIATISLCILFKRIGKISDSK